MMLLEVTANDGQQIGALIDLASDTNYITHAAASRLDLKSEKITLVVQGIGGMTVTANTKRYLLKVRFRTLEGERAHQLVCYGLDEIAKVHHAIKPQQLKRFFPEVKTRELVRPRRIELLISQREGRLVPCPVKVVGDLVLWEGPLGKIVSGTHPNLFEDVETVTYKSKTHFARSMRTAAAKYEEIVKCIVSREETRESGLRQESDSRVRSSMATTKKYWNGGSGRVSAQPVNPSAEDVVVERASQVEKR
ncbi:hypothetical protein AAFF_G00315770 [Aldrovandia affinis]|uniref:Uncharacterized protein n=1 Tax=Aldrovandia affinis TaxID=143900 RepID=A0AAD7WQJ2_9TELE|nr:hypothetical protein AAFF_G00315770 [Aldrovandia affinis]